MISSKPVLTDADRASYPVHLLEGCETGLCLFAAAFLGRNDVAHFEEAGVWTTCVDTDEERLGQMSFYYPNVWNFVPADAWEFAEEQFGQWDAVSVDPFTGDAANAALASLPVWTTLARKFVTVTVTHFGQALVDVPEGWKSSIHARSATAKWLVLERA